MNFQIAIAICALSARLNCIAGIDGDFYSTTVLYSAGMANGEKRVVLVSIDDGGQISTSVLTNKACRAIYAFKLSGSDPGIGIISVHDIKSEISWFGGGKTAEHFSVDAALNLPALSPAGDQIAFVDGRSSYYRRKDDLTAITFGYYGEIKILHLESRGIVSTGIKAMHQGVSCLGETGLLYCTTQYLSRENEKIFNSVDLQYPAGMKLVVGAGVFPVDAKDTLRIATFDVAARIENLFEFVSSVGNCRSGAVYCVPGSKYMFKEFGQVARELKVELDITAQSGVYSFDSLKNIFACRVPSRDVRGGFSIRLYIPGTNKVAEISTDDKILWLNLGN